MPKFHDHELIRFDGEGGIDWSVNWTVKGAQPPWKSAEKDGATLLIVIKSGIEVLPEHPAEVVIVRETVKEPLVLKVWAGGFSRIEVDPFPKFHK